MKQNITKIILILIILISFLLRFVGARSGYPPYHSDEGIGYSAATSMVKNNNYDPLRYDYPSLVPLINVGIYKSVFIPFYWVKFYILNFEKIIDGMIKLPIKGDEYKRIFQLDILGNREINTLFWSRYITAFFGVGVSLLTYFLAKKIFSKEVGLISMYLVAVNFRQVLNSHLGLPDIYNAFFLLASCLATFWVYKLNDKFSYFLAGLSIGLYFSVKFQFFTVLPLLAVFVYSVFRKKANYVGLMISLLTAAFVAVILNPYLIINFENFIRIQSYQMLKYGSGAFSIFLYSFSYLYQIGIGKVISILAILGIGWGLIKNFKQSLLLVLVIFQFFFVFTFYSTGGFYTRNFVTITPLVLIFAGYLIYELSKLVKNRKIGNLLLIILVVLISFAQLKDSLKVAQEYSKPWNFEILAHWIIKNIPDQSIVAAHSSVPLQDSIKRSSYDFHLAFLMDEFGKEGADYAVISLDSAVNESYWWMGKGDVREAVHYWVKPVEVLEQTFSAMALREVESSGVYAVVNPWQAPDSNFVVAKVPKYNAVSGRLVKTFDFRNGLEGWRKNGKMWYTDETLYWSGSSLIIKGGGTQSPILRWESSSLAVEGWKGFEIKYSLRSESDIESARGGYIIASFYRNDGDALSSVNRVGVRLSQRNTSFGVWEEKNLVGIVPEGATRMVIEFRNYSVPVNNYLEKLELFNSEVNIDYGGVKINPVTSDQNILFPNSHGNL